MRVPVVVDCSPVTIAGRECWKVSADWMPGLHIAADKAEAKALATRLIRRRRSWTRPRCTTRVAPEGTGFRVIGR